MKRIKKLVLSEAGFVALIIFLAVGISFWPTVYEYLNRGRIFPDREFELVYGFIWDFHAYLSKMIQGARGGWLVFEKFTTEAHQPSLLQIFYLLLGKVGAIFGQSTVFSYHFFRIFFGMLWFIGGYFFIKYCFPQNKLLTKLTFLLFVFSGNIPKLLADQAGYGYMFLGQKWELYLSGWSHMLPSTRPTFVPHWNAGHLGTALTLIFLGKWLGETNLKKRYWWVLLAGLSALASGFILPPTLIISQVVFGLYTIYKITACLVKKQDWKTFLRQYKSTMVFWILSAIPLVYNLWITRIYPWKALVEGDMNITRYAFNYTEYLMGLGITSYIGLLGGFLVILMKKERLYFASLWTWGTFILILLFDKFLVWHNQTRFVQVGVELPLAILTVYLLNFLFSFWKRWRSSLLTISVIILLLPMILVWSIGNTNGIDFTNQKILGLYPTMMMGPFVVYPSRDVWEALKFLDHERNAKNVFSGSAFGNYLGAYTGKFAYIGHGAQTVFYYQEKLPNVERFYKGEMKNKEALDIFKKHKIGYVVFGPEEKTWGEAALKYDFLQPIFEKKEIVVFKVKNTI